MGDRGLVLAADVDALSSLEELVGAAASVPAFKAIKVGAMLGLRYGLPRIAAVVDNRLPIIYDHQKAGTDIPAMGANFAALCADSGIDQMIIFPQAGPETLKAFVQACLDRGVDPIVGLTMSHPSYLDWEGGWIDGTSPSRIFKLATSLGVDKFVLPGNKLDLVRKYGGDMRDGSTIFMPGIGTQGGAVATACEAAEPHMAMPIIGSAIYKSDDPKREMERFARGL